MGDACGMVSEIQSMFNSAQPYTARAGAEALSVAKQSSVMLNMCMQLVCLNHDEQAHEQWEDAETEGGGFYSMATRQRMHTNPRELGVGLLKF